MASHPPWSVLLGLVAILGSWTASLEAGTGGVIQLPDDPRGAGHGVRLELDTRWLDGNGYRPIRVRMATTPAAPSPRQRAFRISLEPLVPGVNTDRPRGPGVLFATGSRWSAPVASSQLVLPEGETAAEITLLVPQSSSWAGLRVLVEEGGRRLAECSSDDGIPLESPSNPWTEVTPTVLLVSRHVPRWSNRFPGRGFRESGPEGPTTRLPRLPEIATLLPLDPTRGFMPGAEQVVEFQNNRLIFTSGDALDDARLEDVVRHVDRLEMIALDDFPSRWIELSSVDLLLIDLEDARQLSERFPVKWNALRTWVEAGQTLIVFGLDAEFHGLDELARLLNLASHDVAGAPAPAWRTPSGNSYGQGFASLQRLYSNVPMANFSFGGAQAAAAAVPPPPPHFQSHSVGLGRVVAVARSDPFASREELAWVLNSIEANQWSWFVRHGMSLVRDNYDARMLHIPGVGQPPRVSYLVLITLFALAIGPLNYWALWRCRRLHLLLLTVPLAALGVTILLFGYVVVRDGFQVRVLARSFTLLDQRQGRAVTWSTQSYFASLPPADGLSFSDTTLVYPLNFLNRPPDTFAGNRRLSLQLNWAGDQRLRGGYLRPREMQHFLVVAAGNQPARLKFDLDGSDWRVTNELGAKVRYLLVRAGPDELLLGDELEVGASALLRTRDDADADARGSGLLPFFQEHDLSMVMPGRYSPSSYWAPPMTIDYHVTEPRLATGVLETWLGKLRTSPDAALPPRSYVAVVEWPEWFEVGVVQPRREPSLHVVMGHW